MCAKPDLVVSALANLDIVQQLSAHNEWKILHNKVQAVKLALRNQLIDASESKCLHTLRNSTTDMISDDVPTIITFLQTTYGQIMDIEIIKMEQNLTWSVYDTTRPVGFVFSKII